MKHIIMYQTLALMDSAEEIQQILNTGVLKEIGEIKYVILKQ